MFSQHGTFRQFCPTTVNRAMLSVEWYSINIFSELNWRESNCRLKCLPSYQISLVYHIFKWFGWAGTQKKTFRFYDKKKKKPDSCRYKTGSWSQHLFQTKREITVDKSFYNLTLPFFLLTSPTPLPPKKKSSQQISVFKKSTAALVTWERGPRGLPGWILCHTSTLDTLLLHTLFPARPYCLEAKTPQNA